MISDQAENETKDHSRECANGADHSAFDDEHEHHTGASCAERAENRDVPASFDYDENQHRRDVECGDRDDETDDDESHATFEGECGEEWLVRLLPIDKGVTTAKNCGNVRGDLLHVVSIADLHAHH